MNERAAFFSNRETTDYGRHMHIKRSDAGIKNPLDCEILEPGSRFFASIFWAERGEKRESKKTLTTLISVSVFYVFRLTHTHSHTQSVAMIIIIFFFGTIFLWPIFNISLTQCRRLPFNSRETAIFCISVFLSNARSINPVAMRISNYRYS